MEKSGDDDMFMNEYNHSVDIKGRIIVPSKLREELGEKFVLTVGLDGCLFMYPFSEWEKFVEQLVNLPGSAVSRNIQRYFMSNASECEVDKQGRFLVPQKLREAAGIDIEGKVVLVGVINKIELWSKEKWDEINNFSMMDMTEAAEAIEGFDIKC